MVLIVSAVTCTITDGDRDAGNHALPEIFYVAVEEHAEANYLTSELYAQYNLVLDIEENNNVTINPIDRAYHVRVM